MVEVYVISEWEGLYTEQSTEHLASWQLSDRVKNFLLSTYREIDGRKDLAAQASLDSNSHWSTREHLLTVRVSGITRRTPKRKPTALHDPNTPFLFIKLLRKRLNFILLSFIFIILYFLRI